jgi:hypothetical protein
MMWRRTIWTYAHACSPVTFFLLKIPPVSLDVVVFCTIVWQPGVCRFENSPAVSHVPDKNFDSSTCGRGCESGFQGNKESLSSSHGPKSPYLTTHGTLPGSSLKFQNTKIDKPGRMFRESFLWCHILLDVRKWTTVNQSIVWLFGYNENYQTRLFQKMLAAYCHVWASLSKVYTIFSPCTRVLRFSCYTRRWKRRLWCALVALQEFL